MLHVFKTHLDHSVTNANLPAPVAQSLQTQSIKLAAIDIPENVNPGTQQLIRRAIDESFVSGFRVVLAMGAAFAVASAATALIFIGAAREVAK